MHTLTSSGASAVPHAGRRGSCTLPDITRLPDLWRRRMRLSRLEMGDIYLLVQDALGSYDPPEVRALREDKEDLIAQFIFSKVLRLDTAGHEDHVASESAPTNRFALCAYFRRYLIDRLRSASYRRDVSIDIDAVAGQAHACCQAEESPVQTLLDHGLDEAFVRRQAHAFVEALDEFDRLVLAGSLGARHGRKGGLQGVAEEHGVPSYHQRARKLGVSLRKSATADDFANTWIGRWIKEGLHVDIFADNREVILVVIDLLAAEASA
jgi:hypothetical protein